LRRWLWVVWPDSAASILWQRWLDNQREQVRPDRARPIESPLLYSPPCGPPSHGSTSTSSGRCTPISRFHRDQHYLVDKDKVVIIDKFTGRRMPDRHWSDGLHQAVEAKEGVPGKCRRAFLVLAPLLARV